MIDDFLEWSVGNIKTTPLSERLLYLFSLSAALGAFASFIIDGIQVGSSAVRYPILSFAISISTFVLYFYSYRSRHFCRSRRASYPIIYFTLLGLWYNTGGVSHFFSTAFLYFNFFYVFIVPKNRIKWLVLFNFAFYCTLNLIEFYNPSFVQPALHGTQRLISYGSATLVTLIGFLLGVKVINNSFTFFNAQLEQDRAKLEALSDIQSQMISIISHDVRAPLANIYTLLSMVKTGVIPLDKSSTAVSQIMRNVVSSREVLESMTGWTRAQIRGVHDGDLEASFTQPAVPAEIIESNIDDWRDLAADKNIEIKQLIHCSASTRIAADNNLLRTALRNIVLNAVKYTPTGGLVQLTLMKVNNLVLITIVDNGVGMSIERVTQLFKGKLNSKKGTDNEMGSGIGLYIVNDMLTRIGAKIEVKSELGKGTVFTLTFEEFVG